MSLTDFEQNFVSHIRTLQIKRKSSRKDEGTDFVFLSLKTIKAYYFPKDHEKAIDNLKSQGEIEFLKIKKDNCFYYKFKALKDGPIDFGLLKDECRKLDNLELLIKANLRWVSLEQGIDSTEYFNQFLKQRDKHLDSFFLVDTFSGRIHTPITSLKGAFRKHLYLKNEPVVSLDIGQIQPLLLSLILIENIGKNEFSDWINQGEDIYLIFKEKLNLKSREDAKTKFYEITFGIPNERLGEMFGKADWIQWINQVKSIALPQNPNSKTKAHSNLAWLLQSTEVRIMRVIWQKLIDNDILFLTVHDEIIVRASDLDESYKIMEDELKFYFPSFKINQKAELNTPDLDDLEKKLKKLDCRCLHSKEQFINKYKFSFDEFIFMETHKLILAFDEQNYSLNIH